jgi:DNA processing protein
MKNFNLKIGIIALSGLKGIGPSFIKKFVTENLFPSSNALDNIKKILVENNREFDDDTIQAEIDKASEIIYKCREDNISIIEYPSSDYPLRLKEIKDPPPILYCKGNIELLYQKAICIIGTREPNENGATIAERLGAYYSSSNWVICNGLAVGIDSCSIKPSEKYNSKIIGVLGGGLNYNSCKTLLQNTAENAERVSYYGGLLVSENPPDKKEDTFTVIKSCRIQAGISMGLILVQSSMDGGSKFTIKTFCETPRPLAIIHPVERDYYHSTYQANREIIENQKKGIAKFTELKEDKIQTKTIVTIKSKGDYQEFEGIILKEQKAIEEDDYLLFH